MSTPKETAVNVAPALQSQLERGLSDLRCACVVIDELNGDNDFERGVAALALIQRGGALIETSLRSAKILTGPAVVGGAPAWLDMVELGGGEK